MKGTELELLMAIANQGCIDSVMDAARSANAGGGTGDPCKRYRDEKRGAVFRRVSGGRKGDHPYCGEIIGEKCHYEGDYGKKSGLKSKDKAIVFSLPVTAAVGVRLEDDQEDDA